MIARLFMSTRAVRIKNLNDDINVNETSTKQSEDDKKQLQNESFERSAAIERAYVHEVYENCEEELNSSGIRSKVAQFITNLDPGSIICDVGCGNGRYLSSGYNSSIYSIGVERCFRIAKLAKASSVEVAICDNLILPFRDESFDAVLSLSVVHHFATSERRINAIKELTRVLKVGGKIVLSVWAFEQKSRRFDGNSSQASQDVLIPWQSNSKNTITSDDDDDDDYLTPYHAYNFTDDSIHSNSSRSQGDGDSSSLSSTSSPNDTCYSFVRRALQKLAGGKKSPWFLDSWNSREAQKESSFDYEDAKDLPIELRRLEDCGDFQDHMANNVKSRSLGSILNPPRLPIVRSRSSVPSLGQEFKISNMHESSVHDGASNCTQNINYRRPKLTKQKQSINFMDGIEFSLHDSSSLIFNNQDNEIRSQSFRKQSSLNEELMAESRIREKERIRKKIQKQMSLNETFLCRSLLSKRLQTLREGLTTKLKTSTGSLERMTKSSFVKIIQNIKTVNVHSNEDIQTNVNQYDEKEKLNEMKAFNLKKRKSYDKSFEVVKIESIDKFHKENGSDSSKESSLQSDTSVESEDSFASVIYVPKKTEVITPTTIPNSPLICPTPINSPALNSDNFQKQLASKDYSCFNFETHQKVKQNQESNSNENIEFIKQRKKISYEIKACLNEKKISKIGDLSPIPKYKKLSNFPIVKRSSSSNILSKNVIVPRLTSLDLFNPEIDDIDSESSDDEPSSSDSIDSVINTTSMKIQDKQIHINENDTDLNADMNKYSITNGLNDDVIDFVDKVNSQLLKKLGDNTSIIHEQSTWSQNGYFEINNTENNNFKEEKTNQIDDEESPPLSAKIQSHLSQNAILPSNQNLIIRQQPKISDFILEENEEIDEEILSKNLRAYNGITNDTTLLIQDESFDDSETISPTKTLLKNFKHSLSKLNQSSSNTNSLENSHSTSTSLDSPSAGGSATHHVFHHIFRQHELDELINKHVGDLHIVSSYCDAKSWFVVCEKVHVWTI